MPARTGSRPRGRPPYPGVFTPAEQRVLEGLRRGLTYQQIAAELGISYDTVKYHVSNMLGKAGVESREELVAWAGTQPGLLARLLGLPAWLRFALAGTALAGLAAAAIVAAVLIAGGGLEPAPPAVPATGTATSTPTPTATPSPAGSTPTGVRVVDDFIAAVLSGDPARVEPLIHYRPVPCVPLPPPPGGERCLEGMAEGTPRDLFLVLGTEGTYLTPDEVHDRLSWWIDGLDVVYAASRHDGGYAIVFTSSSAPSADRGISFLLDDRGATQMDGTGRSALAVAARYPDFLIAPPPPPLPPPDLRRTGVAAVDAILEAVAVRDLLGLMARLRTTPVACAIPSDGAVACPEGVPPGTAVDAIAVQMCEPPVWLPAEETRAYILDNVVGPAPVILAVARGDGTDGVAYWVIVDQASMPVPLDRRGRALGLAADGTILVLNQGCNASPEDLLATFRDFLLPPP